MIFFFLNRKTCRGVLLAMSDKDLQSVHLKLQGIQSSKKLSPFHTVLS